MNKIWYTLGALFILTAITLSAGCISSPTDTPTPMTAVPTTTPTPVSTPVEVLQNQVMTLTEEGNTLSISITGKLFDSDAENVLTEGSASNPTPEPGQYVIMLKIVETYIGGDEPAVNVAPYHFEIYVDGIGYPAISAVLPDGYTTFPTDSILKNATEEGWLAYIVPQGNAKLAYEYQEEPLGFIRINY